MKTTIAFFLLCLNLSAFSQTTSPANTKPFILGVIDEIQSAQLNEKRILNIYLPEGYNPKDTIQYPVIYLLDGSADEDFIHITGLVQFYNFPWINRLPKSIVVGIANTDRRRDFTFPTTIQSDKAKNPTSGKSATFITFLEKELQPFIENKYKASSEKTLIGQSLGGLLAAEILLSKPLLFNKYIIISPSLWWDNGSLLQHKGTIYEETFTRQTDVYIGVGKEGATPGPNPRIMEDDAKLFATSLKASKSKHLKVHFDYMPLENHATTMHQAVMNAFGLIYPVSKTP